MLKKELQDAVITGEQMDIFTYSSSVRGALEKNKEHFYALIATYDAAKDWTQKEEQYQSIIKEKDIRAQSFSLLKKLREV